MGSTKYLEKVNKNTITAAIVQTLIYSDIFHFPLQIDEIWRYLISDRTVRRDTIATILSQSPDGILLRNGYFAVSSQTLENTKNRLRQKQASEKKIAIARKVTRLMKYIPSVYFIGVSGTVAFSGAKESDDIDLFVITAPNLLWTTRLFLIIILEILRKRRRFGNQTSYNVFCLNMFMDGSQLLFPSERQDVYTAQEIMHVVPLMSRNNTYKELITINKWIKKFLANAYQFSLENLIKEEQKSRQDEIIYRFLLMGEPWMKRIQAWYLKRHHTTETITTVLLAFHPRDYRNIVLNKFKKTVGKKSK